MKARIESVEVKFEKKLPTGKYCMEHIGVTLKGTIVCETDDELLESTYDLFSQARRLVDSQVWATKQINNIE